jgi:hypothetical protein
MDLAGDSMIFISVFCPKIAINEGDDQKQLLRIAMPE